MTRDQAVSGLYVQLETWKKWCIVSILVVCSAQSTLSAYTFFPIASKIALDFSTYMENVDRSLIYYSIAQALSPSFWGPIADVYGRRHILIIALLIYSGANLGLCFVANLTSLMAFRFFQAFGSTMLISVATGVVTDITSPENRGGYTGTLLALRQLNIMIGPFLGGILAQHLGWHSVFAYLTLCGFGSAILVALFLPETRPGLETPKNGLERLRSMPCFRFLTIEPNMIAISNAQERRNFENDFHHKRQILSMHSEYNAWSFKELLQCYWTQLTALVRMDIIFLTLFAACINATWACVTASTAHLLKSEYDLSMQLSGYCFIPNGVGCFFGSMESGRQLNKDFRLAEAQWCFLQSKKNASKSCDPEKSASASGDCQIVHEMPKSPYLPTDFPLEHARSAGTIFQVLFLVLSTLVYGWSINSPSEILQDVKTEAKGGFDSALIVLLLAQFGVGYAAAFILNANSTLLIDLLPCTAVTAVAMGSLVRFVVEAVCMTQENALLALGSGYFSVVLASIAAASLIPFGVSSYCGQHWRKQRVEKVFGVAEASAIDSSHIRWEDEDGLNSEGTEDVNQELENIHKTSSLASSDTQASNNTCLSNRGGRGKGGKGGMRNTTSQEDEEQVVTHNTQ